MSINASGSSTNKHILCFPHNDMEPHTLQIISYFLKLPTNQQDATKKEIIIIVNIKKRNDRLMKTTSFSCEVVLQKILYH